MKIPITYAVPGINKRIWEKPTYTFKSMVEIRNCSNHNNFLFACFGEITVSI